MLRSLNAHDIWNSLKPYCSQKAFIIGPKVSNRKFKTNIINASLGNNLELNQFGHVLTLWPYVLRLKSYGKAKSFKQKILKQIL